MKQVIAKKIHIIKVKPISFNKNYGVDREGNFYSRLYQLSIKGQQGIQTKKGQWKKIKGTVTAKGYIQINIAGKTYRLNRLIAQTFIPNPNNYPEVQHVNDIKIDNQVKNLKWGNQKHNAKDRDRNGHWYKGEKSFQAKLTNKQAQEIRREKLSKSLNMIAKEYNVSKKAILLIIQNKTYKSEEVII